MAQWQYITVKIIAVFETAHTVAIVLQAFLFVTGGLRKSS